MSTTHLVVLGLLGEGPKHGYELRSQFEQRALDHYTSLTAGNLYHALGKLQKLGFIEEVGTEQVGRRPPRTVYGLTPAGRQELRRLVREALSTPESPHYAVNAALALAYPFPTGELIAALEHRLGAQRGLVAHLQAEVGEVRANIGRLASQAHLHLPRVEALGMAMIHHTLAHARAELSWLEEMVQRLHELEDQERP